MTLASGCLRGRPIAARLVAPACAAFPASPALDRIRASGALPFAHRDGATPFSGYARRVERCAGDRVMLTVPARRQAEPEAMPLEPAPA